MKNILYSIIIAFTLSIGLSSCAKIENDLTTPVSMGVHKEGIGTISSPNFHTTIFASNNWNLKECWDCHGANYTGGTTGINCRDCHTEPAGPEACNTCHGVFANPARIAPPTDLLGSLSTSDKGVGAHAVHIYDTKITEKIACFECHPSNPPGTESFVFNHIDGIPAEIEFGSSSVGYQSMPTYDFANNTCANTYCHGNFIFLKDSAASNLQFAYAVDTIKGNNFNPKWNQVDGTQAVCGTCHGLPPEGHLFTTPDGCHFCHTGVVDAQGNIIDPLKHINGKANVYGN